MTNIEASASVDTLIHLGDGLHVSPQGYGAMSLSDSYGPVSDDDAFTTLVHAVDSGATYVDTANVYGGGNSERIISRLLRTRRDEVQLASKVGIAPHGRAGERSLNGEPGHIREQLELSLARLDADHLDLYYLHRVDPQVPVEESIGAIADLVEEGKVRHVGISEATADELRRAHATHPIAAIQSEWSILSRDVEKNVIPAARELGVGVVPYAPVGRQWLTGAYDPSAIGEGDVRHKFPRFTAEALAANAPLLDEVRAVGAEAGLTPAQVALAWLDAKGREIGVPVVSIPGTRHAARVTENLGAVGAVLDDAQVARLDALADRVHGQRTFDPTWVSLGRE